MKIPINTATGNTPTASRPAASSAAKPSAIRSSAAVSPVSPASGVSRRAGSPAAAGALGTEGFGEDPFAASGGGDGFPASTPQSRAGYAPYQPPSTIATKQVRRSSNDWESWLTDNPKLLKAMGIACAAGFVLSAIPLLGMFLFFAVFLLFLLIQTAGGIWLLVVAFNEDVTQGLLYLFLPFYPIYYLVTRWDRCKAPFMLCIISFTSLCFSLAGMLIGTLIFGTLFG